MNRLVLDRLWPLLVGLVALVAGALALEEYARRRGNQTVVIEIRKEDALASGDGDDDGAPEAGGTSEAAESFPPLDETHAHARLAARRADFDEALRLFAQVVSAHPDSAPLRGEVGAWLLAARRPQESLPHLERATALKPEVPQFALDLARARSATGDVAGAEKELRSLLERRPSYRAARVALGSILHKRGALAEAIAELKTASSSGGNEERASALVALGAAHLAAKQREEATHAFEQAILFAPARVEVRLGTARAYLESGQKEDLERAMEMLQRTAELAPDLATVHSALGRAYERRDDNPAAVAAYERALQLDPGYRYVRRRLLRISLERKDFTRARLEAERLLQDAPDVPEHHFLAALVADREDRADPARQHYREAISRAKGNYPEAFLNLGLLEKSEGHPDKAQQAFEEALKLRPDYRAAYNNLGGLHADAGRLAEAEAAYRKAIELDASYASAWYNLGELFSRQGKYAEAIPAYQGALKARPSYTRAMLNLGVAYVRSGQRAEALATYRKLVTLAPRYTAAWYNLALALEAQGQRAEALEALRQALTIDSEHALSQRKLGELELLEGHLAEAQRAYEDLLDLKPGDLGARIALAELLGKQGDGEGCRQRAQALRAEAPTDERLQGLLGKCATASAQAAPP